MGSFVAANRTEDKYIGGRETFYVPFSQTCQRHPHCLPGDRSYYYVRRQCPILSCFERDQRPIGIRRIRRRQASKQPEPGGVSRSLVRIAQHHLPWQSRIRLKSMRHVTALLRRGCHPARQYQFERYANRQCLSRRPFLAPRGQGIQPLGLVQGSSRHERDPGRETSEQ